MHYYSHKNGGGTMKNNPLKQLGEFGQSFWIDYIRRDFIATGGLKRMIDDDGLRGMTSNPAIFEKAFDDSHDYDRDIEAMFQKGMDAKAIYEAITLSDVQMAADEFRPVYEGTKGADGYVSLEVNPHLAHDTEGTIGEARRLWAELDRPNVLIKVPATVEGLPAIRRLISEGININVTLLFGLPRYRQVAQAYIEGLQERLARGKTVKNVASVASFFLSRIDAQVDPMLEKIIKENKDMAEIAAPVLGETAVSCAKMAYQIYKEIFNDEGFKEIAENGGRTQRVLWASTGTKNPDYGDVKYIEALIGPDTVTTIPIETLNAYRDHGKPGARLERCPEQAGLLLKQLPGLGVNIDRVARQLEDEGVDKFNKPFDKIMEILELKKNS
jgi:transaldolase